MHTHRMKIRAMGLVMVGLLAGGCATDDAQTAPVASSEISVQDNRFEPRAVEVPMGTEVTWTWEGDSQHNVVADAFSSDVQSEGTFRHAFDQPGTYRYRCTLHGGMDGTVLVGPQEAPA